MADLQSTATDAAPAILGGSFESDTAAEFLAEFISASEPVLLKRIPVWDEVMDNYMMASLPRIGHYFPRLGAPQVAAIASPSVTRRTGSRLRDPETHLDIEQLATQSIGLLMGSKDYVQAVPVGKDDPDKARQLSRLLQAILEQPQFFLTQYLGFKQAYLLGIAIAELGWEVRSRTENVRFDIVDEQGIIVGTQMIPQEVMYRDRPLFRLIDPRRFYPDPSGTRIQDDMQGCAKMFEITKRAATQLGESEVYDNVQAAVNSTGSSERSPQPRASRDLRARGHADERERLPGSYGVMTGFEFWGEVPYRPSDGIRNRVITVIEGVTVRNKPNPFAPAEIPFKEMVVNPLPGRFHGLGAGEVIRFLQDSANTLLMAGTDAAIRASKPSVAVGRKFDGNLEQLEARDTIIECRDPSDMNVIPQDYNVITTAFAILQQQKEQMRDASGAPGAQALPSQRKSATEASEFIRLTSQRSELMVQLLERDFYPWLGRTLHARLLQFLPAGGASARLAGDAVEVPLEDIQFQADVRFHGSRQVISKFQRAAQYRELFNTVGAAPELLQLLPTPMLRYFRDILEFNDAEELIREALQGFAAFRDARLQEAQAGAAARGGGGPPPGPANLGALGGEIEREGTRVA